MITFHVVFRQVMSLGHRADEMQHASGLMSGPMASQAGVTSSFSSAIMDDTDDYLEYMGGGGGGAGSPLGLSSESSNQDRSCTSTPVGNDSSPAGEGTVNSKTPTHIFGLTHVNLSHLLLMCDDSVVWLTINRRES